jgi:hypothetical protein
MKNIINFIIVSALVITTISCEKVIDLNLKNESQKYVIEAIVNKDSIVNYVKITKTIDFDKNSSYPTVDNAIVVISDNEGNNETLTLVSPGLYKTSSLLGVVGRTYNLVVTIDGQVFSSKSTMPIDVPIDTVSLQEFSFGPIPNYFPIVERIDTKDVKNYYAFNLYKNNKRIDGIYLQDDQFNDGVNVLQPIFGGDCTNKDTLRIEMACIDEFVYKYFSILSANGGGTGGAIPANPESNISGGCLGYFSAQTFQTRTVVIP